MFYIYIPFSTQDHVQNIMQNFHILNNKTNLNLTTNNKTDRYYAVDIACMVVYFCMMIPIIFGNGLVLRTISLFENLHGSTHILIGSLATAGNYQYYILFIIFKNPIKLTRTQTAYSRSVL